MTAVGGGAGLPDYSLDFSKIRAARIQRRKAQSWSNSAVNSTRPRAAELDGGGRQRERGPRTAATPAPPPTAQSRQPIRAPPNKVTFCSTPEL
jgi:hypothetical protein